MVSHDVKIRVVILFEFYETSPRRVSCISYDMTTSVKPEYITSYEIIYMCVSCSCRPSRVAQSVGHLTRKSGVLGSIPGLATYFGFLLPLFQEGQLSVTGESMCTKYWLTA